MKNLLIGAISGNYTRGDVETWVLSSAFEGVERVLLLYNRGDVSLENYLKQENILVINPTFDFWGQEVGTFNVNTGDIDTGSSYTLVHNIRFFHIWSFLLENRYSKVLITDVKDVCFNGNPFEDLVEGKLTVTSEEILYRQEDWNQQHLHMNLGLIGLAALLEQPVYNVGVFGGDYDLVKEMCADVYLLACGKYKVADQTSFNYLINTKYKNKVKLSTLADRFTVHLHVIHAKLVPFDLHTISNYKIIHQYDRFGDEIQHYYTLPR